MTELLLDESAEEAHDQPMTSTTLPTVKQMAVRSNDGHAKALRCIAEGKPVVREGAFASEIRGMRTVLGTLSRWECIDAAGLTDRGRELLDFVSRKAS